MLSRRHSATALQPRVIELPVCLPFALLDAHVRGDGPIDGGELRVYAAID
jgi:hypothetical protein